MKKEIFFGVISIIAISIIAFFFWKIGLSITYKLSYEHQVRSTIQEIVKEESLK